MDGFPETRSENVRARPVLAGNSIYAGLLPRAEVSAQLPIALELSGIWTSRPFKIEWLFHHGGAKFEKLGHPNLIRKHYRGKDEILGDKHDAYYDVQASMAELAYYRSRFRKIEE